MALLAHKGPSAPLVSQRQHLILTLGLISLVSRRRLKSFNKFGENSGYALASHRKENPRV